MSDKIKNAPDRARSEAGLLSEDDLVRISKRIIGVLEEEHCTVAQASEILRFTHSAASSCTLVKCVSFSTDAQ